MADVEATRRETAQELGVDEDRVLNSFDCRKPVYEGRFLYFYRGCNGVFGRIRRDRIVDIFATGYCGVPVRRFKVL